MAAEAAGRRRFEGRGRFIVPLILLLCVVALLEKRLEYLSTSYAFYGWLDARITETDLFISLPGAEEEEDTEEDVFFQNLRTHLDEQLAASYATTVSELEPAHLWKIVLAEMKSPTRWEFESLARQGKLDLPYGAIEWSEETVGAHLGSLILGFRSAVADLLWLKVDDYWHQGRMEMMLPMMYTVVRLDPHFIDAWAVGAWHLAYNAGVTVDTLEEKKEFVYKAIDFLQDGIKRNPRHYQLYYELGFPMYFVKLEDYKNAAHYLEQSRRYRPPANKWIDRMLLHAYERGGELEKAFEGWKAYLEKVDPDSDVARRFILQLRAEIAQRDGREDDARGLWRQIIEKFPGVAEKAEVEIIKIDAKRAESAGDYDKALALWQSLANRVYPGVYDEALANIARLNLLRSADNAPTSSD